MLRRLSTTVLSWILITQFALATDYRPQAETVSKRVSFPAPHQLTKDVVKAIESPLLAMLKEAKSMPPVDLNFQNAQSLLDEDPFFLRSQEWVESDLDGSQYRATDDGIYLKIDEVADKAIQINLPLVPIGISDDYIILNAKSDQFFKEKFESDMESYSEGLFVIAIEEFKRLSISKHPVPIFYFPLPTGSWTGTRPAIYQPQFDSITVTDSDGQAISIEQNDIDQLVKVERLNLLMAQGEGWKDFKVSQSDEMKQVLPKGNSTAGFGTLFVGPLDSTSTSFIQKTLEKFGISNAIAESESDEKVVSEDQKMRQQLTRVSIILATGLMLGITLKYTIYREHFASKRPPLKNPLRALGQEAKEVLDVYAHILTSISQFSGIVFGNLSEFMLDRYFPAIAAGENRMIRQFMKRTILFTRSASTRVPVNANTWFLGSIVLGGIDTLFVSYQLYNVVPYISGAIGKNIPILESRVESAFGVDNPNIDNINRNELVRNAYAYMSGGAAGFSAEVKVQVSQVVGDEIDKLLLKQGKDPHDPVNIAERNRLLDERLEMKLKQLGLPSKDEFLFDFSTIYEQGMRSIGYNLPAESGGGRVMVTERPGLLIPTLKKAINFAKYQVQIQPQNVRNHQALKILEKSLQDASSMRQWLLRPIKAMFTSKESALGALKDGIKTLNMTRHNLALLTYEGSSSVQLSQLPGGWLKDFDPAAAAFAAELFRKSFNEYQSGITLSTDHAAQDYVKLATKDMRDKAIEGALEQLANQFNVAKNPALQNQYPTLYFHHYYNILRVLYQERELNNAKYRPERVDFLGWWQKKIALKNTNALFKKQYSVQFDPLMATDQQLKFWQKKYIDKLMNTVGLYPDFSDYPELEGEIYQEAEVMSERLFKRESVVKYIDSLSETKRVEFKAFTTANNAIAVYVDKVVNRDSIDALSATQPGVLQWLRRTKYLKADNFFAKTATRILRGLESPGSDVEYRPGIVSWIYRNVPMAYDLTKGFQRSLYRAPTSILATWGFNQLVWGADISMSMWVFFLVLGFTISGPSMTVNRLFHHQALRPMGNWKMMAMMGTVYSWATFWGSVPMQIFAADFQKLWDGGGMLIQKSLELGILPLLESCSRALGG